MFFKKTNASPNLSLQKPLDYRNSMSIYIGNIAGELKEDIVKKMFSKYGKVLKVRIPTDRQTGEIRGIAFVEMGTEAEETAAIHGLSGSNYLGQKLRINKAITNVGKNPLPNL
jgi:RNA recognition motif-containing protein